MKFLAQITPSKSSQEHMSREGASAGLPTDVLGKVLKAVFPYLEHAAGAVQSSL